MINETLTSFSEKNITKKVSYVSFPLRRLRGGGGWGREVGGVYCPSFPSNAPGNVHRNPAVCFSLKLLP